MLSIKEYLTNMGTKERRSCPLAYLRIWIWISLRRLDMGWKVVRDMVEVVTRLRQSDSSNWFDRCLLYWLKTRKI